MSARAKRTRIGQDRVLESLAQWAYFAPLDAYNNDGTMKDLAEMPPQIRSCIVLIETSGIIISK